MSRLFSSLFLALLVLGLFYPTIFAESLSTDDQGMILGYINMKGLDLRHLFWPSSSHYYYRPLLGLSFYVEHILFDNHVAISHFLNILVHLANTLLLFTTLRFLVSDRADDSPLFAAIFFAIHPLVTEPVNWISGRTDLLAGFFVLLSFLIFLRNSKKSLWLDLLAAFFFLCGLCSKEVAIGLLVVILFASLQEQHFAIRRQWRIIVRRFAPFMGATILYGFMRTGGQLAQDIAVMTALRGGNGAEDISLLPKVLSLIKAVGFYTHKILWPFPLNFAIVDINRPLAMVVGLSVLAGLALTMLFWRRRPIMVGIVWIFSFLAPALPVAVNRMAWTPLAERYLYLPLMGLCFVLAVLVVVTPQRKIMNMAIIFLLFCFGTATVQRNIVWQKNLTLWKDVVEKSPNFASGHNDYAMALMRAGKKEEGGKHFALAESLSQGGGNSLTQSNVALQGEDGDKKLALLETILAGEKSPKLRKIILYNMIKIINNELFIQGIVSAKKLDLTRKLLVCQKQLGSLDKNPYHLYRIGQLHLILGEKAEAMDAFTKTCQTSDDYFTPAACKLAQNLALEVKGEK